MKKSILLIVVCLVVSIGLTGAKQPVAKAPAAKEIFDLHRLKDIDKLMKKAIQEEALPSVVCYVAYEGKPIYFKAFGLADREEGITLKKDAIFRNASQTKLITTVALMTLYDQGLFGLEDPVKKYLPEFSNPEVYVSGSVAENNLVTRPAYGDITIRQLLSHSSGIGYDRFDQDVQGLRYPTQMTTEEAVKRIAKLPLKHDPGQGFTYGYNLDVAGRLAEVISGMRLDSLVRRNVLKPLGMDDSYFYLPPKKFKRLIPLYQKPEADATIALATDSLDRFYPISQDQQYFGGGGGMSGTIEDYALICQMILDKGKYGRKGKEQLLSRKTVEQMCTDQLFGNQGDYQFGLGLEIATKEDFARHMRTPGSLQWGGFFGTKYMIDPQNKLVVLMYTNKVSWKGGDSVWDDLLRAVNRSLK